MNQEPRTKNRFQHEKLGLTNPTSFLDGLAHLISATMNEEPFFASTFTSTFSSLTKDKMTKNKMTVLLVSR